MKKTYFKSDNLHSKIINNKVYILSPHDKKNIFELNELGTFLWKKLKTPQTADSLVKKTLANFSGSLNAQVSKDISEWINEMKKNKLVIEKQASLQTI